MKIVDTRINLKGENRLLNQAPRTVAFIDGANLHNGVLELGWRLDYRRFRAYLTDHFQVNRALWFIGYVPQYRSIYSNLKGWGYSLVFRPTCWTNGKEIKGNCDTDLTVRAIAGCCEHRYDKAVLVTGDGDFASVVSFLTHRGRLKGLVAPSPSSCSNLLRWSPIRPTFLESPPGELEYREAEARLNNMQPSLT